MSQNREDHITSDYSSQDLIDDELTLSENENENLKPCTKAKTIKYAKYAMKRYLLDAFTGMGQGLFVTLIAGLIIKQIGKIFGSMTKFGSGLIKIGDLASVLTGPGIGIGIARALSNNNLVIFSAMVAGLLGAFSDKFLAGTWGTLSIPLSPGNPIGAYICSVIACELGNLVVFFKTKLDILLVPLVMFFAVFGGVYVAYPFRLAGTYIAQFIDKSTNAQPFWMSIVMSLWIGLLLTLPTSSAATCISLNVGGIAGGAAVTGCCCHMIGFAVASFRENKIQGLIAQGFGTSMLQIPNLIKHPLILIPQVLSSIILGPIATCIFKLKCSPAASGMGTSGLVGLFGTIDGTGDSIPKWQLALGIIFTQFIGPVLLSIGLSELMRWRGWIKPDDQRLEMSKQVNGDDDEGNPKEDKPVV
jgi:uncharacterized membrane protein